MPWYDYHCEACEHSFEARMPVERRDEAVCPACGSRRVRRAMPRVVTVLAAAGGPREAGDGGGGDADGCCCGGAEGSCSCAAGAGADDEG